MKPAETLSVSNLEILLELRNKICASSKLHNTSFLTPQPQAQKTKSLHDDKLRNASMRGGVQREVSKKYFKAMADDHAVRIAVSKRLNEEV